MVYTADLLLTAGKNQIMLQFLNRCSQGRGAWLLLALTAFVLELVALFFQYVMQLQPCVMCIYQRTALLGVLASGLVGAIAPKTPLRYIALLGWLYSAWRGLQLAWEHTMIQLHPSPFVTCDVAARFPSWLPLDKWLPSVFVATGDCTVISWKFLSFSMPQWLIVVFAVFLLVAVLVAISQFVRTRRRDLFGR